MVKKITIANSKGGVGKTTVTTLLSYVLAEIGYKVLLVDFDPQANATQIMINTFYDGNNIEYTTISEGIKANDIKSSVHQLTENLYMIPSDLDTTHIRYLFNNRNRYTLLKEHISFIEDNYDFIFFDVPPTFTTEFIENALSASDYFIILTETSSFSLQGISKFYSVADEIHNNINPKLDFLGILINMRENNKKLNLILDEQYSFSNTDEFFKNYFPRKTRIAGYGTYGLFKRDLSINSIMRYDRWDIELKEITKNVANELIEKIKEREM